MRTINDDIRRSNRERSLVLMLFYDRARGNDIDESRLFLF